MIKNKNLVSVFILVLLFLSVPIESSATKVKKFRDKWWRINFEHVYEDLHYTEGNDGKLVLGGGEVHCSGAGDLKCRAGAGYYFPFIDEGVYSEPEINLIKDLLGFAEDKVDKAGILTGIYAKSITVVDLSGNSYTKVFQVSWHVEPDDSLIIEVEDIHTTPVPSLTK